MSFELLDNILEGSGEDPIYSKTAEENKLKEGAKGTEDTTENIEEGAKDTENAEKNIEEGAKGTKDTENKLEEGEGDEMYADLDDLVESAMRETLKRTITESSVVAETKLQHLQIVEDADFDQDQMMTFMDETIHPILTFSGILDEGVDLETAVVTSLPLFETIVVLDSAYNGTLIESEEDTAGYDKLTESVIKEGKEVEIDENALVEALTEVFDKYEIPEDQQESLLDEAIELYTNTSEDVAIIPSIKEVSECVVAYNNIAESEGLPTAFEVATYCLDEKAGFLKTAEDKTKEMRRKQLISRVKGAPGKAAAAVKSGAASVYGSAKKGTVTAAGAVKKGAVVAGKGAKKGAVAAAGAAKKGAVVAGKGVRKGASTTYSAVKKAAGAVYGKGKKVMATKAGKIGAGAVGAAALGTAATLAWKKRKAAGAEDKQAATAAIAAIKGQMSKCTTDKCRASAQKQIAKWKSRM